MGNWLRSRWGSWLMAVLVFFGISLFYMGPAITDCSSTTTAFNSDSTGGLAWFQWAGGNDLSWGTTDKSNYPFGERIDRPQFITSQAFHVPYKVFSSLSSPVCGLNLMVLTGYMTTALLMFGLVRWLFRRTAIAYFAGYAAAFVPAHQFKAQSHIVYASAAVFIAIIWAYLWFLQRPSYRRAGLLAAAGATGFYTDGYFVLITAVLLGSLMFFGLAQRIFTAGWRKSLSDLKYLIFAGAVLALLLSPILYIQKKYGSEISSTLSAARSPIRLELKTYAARPVEFFVPPYNNPIMPDSYFTWRLNQQHESNPTESTLFIGYTMAALALFALIAALTKKTKKLQLKPNISYRGLATVAGATMLTLFLFSLPYKYTFARVLIKLTENWRVLARFFLAIDPVVIILAAAGLYLLTKKWPKRFYLGFVALLCMILFFEYLMTPLRPHGDLYKDSPQIYRTLASDDSIQEIAEYPLVSLATSPTTFTYAMVHGKKLVNANDSAIARDAYHSAVAGLNDTQTLGVLKAVGVDAVTTIKIDKLTIDGLINYTKSSSDSVSRAYKISDLVTPRPVVLTPSSGFFDLSVDDNQLSHRALRKEGLVDIKESGSHKNASGQYTVKFDIQGQPGMAHLTVSQSGRVLWDGSLERGTVEFTAAGEPPISLSTTVTVDITNMEAIRK